jgi:hypothetical protein
MLFPLDRDIDDAVYSAVVGQPPPDGISNYNAKAVELLSSTVILTPWIALFGTQYLSTPVGDKIYDEASYDNFCTHNPQVCDRSTDFSRHKNAIRAWLLTRINHSEQGRARQAISLIADAEPNNPFFQFLNEGPTERVLQLVETYCPTPQRASSSILFKWLWETGPSSAWLPSSDKAQEDSMLWDCIFMRRLLGNTTLGVDYGPDVAGIVTHVLLALDERDEDGDGVPDSRDNCILVPNADQRDADGDGYGNVCDGDLNNDGGTNTLDLNLYKQAHRSRVGDSNYNPGADFNGDGQINTLDLNIYKELHRKPPGPSGLAP